MIVFLGKNHIKDEEEEEEEVVKVHPGGKPAVLGLTAHCIDSTPLYVTHHQYILSSRKEFFFGSYQLDLGYCECNKNQNKEFSFSAFHVLGRTMF